MKFKIQRLNDVIIMITLCLLSGSCSINEPTSYQLTGKLKLNVSLSIKEKSVKNSMNYPGAEPTRYQKRVS